MDKKNHFNHRTPSPNTARSRYKRVARAQLCVVFCVARRSMVCDGTRVEGSEQVAVEVSG